MTLEGVHTVHALRLQMAVGADKRRMPNGMQKAEKQQWHGIKMLREKRQTPKKQKTAKSGKECHKKLKVSKPRIVEKCRETREVETYSQKLFSTAGKSKTAKSRQVQWKATSRKVR